MSVVGNNRVGIPIVLLHDCEGAVISVETKKGEIIRGLLFEAEDMMNLYIKNAIVWNVHGVKRKVDQLYLRGREIMFIIIPSMLRHAPMFQRIKHWRKHGGAPPEGVGAAVGQAAAILRKANERRSGFGGRGFEDKILVVVDRSVVVVAEEVVDSIMVVVVAEEVVVVAEEVTVVHLDLLVVHLDRLLDNMGQDERVTLVLVPCTIVQLKVLFEENIYIHDIHCTLGTTHCEDPYYVLCQMMLKIFVMLFAIAIRYMNISSHT